MAKRLSTFSIAHTDISSAPFNNAQRTVRVLIPNNLEGNALRIKFSNYYSNEPCWIGSARIALSDKKGELIPDTDRPITVNGDNTFALVPQRDLYSDPIQMEVLPGQVFAVSLYYPSANKITSGNFIGNFASRSVRGDYCSAAVIPTASLWTKLSHSLMPWDASSAITTLSGVVVETERYETKRVIAAFGDSIMQQSTWTTPFTLKLYQQYPGEVSFCNLGIGGNRLLHNSPAYAKGLYGNAGIKRYIYDLLPIEGLTHVIFGLGTNDLGLPGKEGTPDSELISLKEYANAVTQLAKELHARNIKIYGCTLLPREISGVYTNERESIRLAINSWIKAAAPFDAVLDLAAAVVDTDGVGMVKEYCMPDGLHPNALGGKVLAQSIDLSLFK
ncbi:MAG: GDSL-type esterase/lipase family protein [Oscillospiraceae bacterium]